jgi:hypothetical protein
MYHRHKLLDITSLSSLQNVKAESSYDEHHAETTAGLCSVLDSRF